MRADVINYEISVTMRHGSPGRGKTSSDYWERIDIHIRLAYLLVVPSPARTHGVDRHVAVLRDPRPGSRCSWLEDNNEKTCDFRMSDQGQHNTVHMDDEPSVSFTWYPYVGWEKKPPTPPPWIGERQRERWPRIVLPGVCRERSTPW